MGLSEVARRVSEVEKENQKEHNRNGPEHRIFVKQPLPEVESVPHGVVPPQVDQEMNGYQTAEKKQQSPAKYCGGDCAPSAFQPAEPVFQLHVQTSFEGDPCFAAD